MLVIFGLHFAIWNYNLWFIRKNTFVQRETNDARVVPRLNQKSYFLFAKYSPYESQKICGYFMDFEIFPQNCQASHHDVVRYLCVKLN